jgi:hypothetical protein
MRTFEGKEEVVGVAGRTLTLVCGDFARFEAVETEGDASEAEEVDEALECEWWWWMERTEETEELVDFRPRRPAEDRR